MTDPAVPVPQAEPVPIKEARTVIRRLSAIAPLAAAYGVFQAILSGLPASLSTDSLRYLLAIASGVAAGSLTACAALWGTRNASQPHTMAAPPVAPPIPAQGDSILILCQKCADTVGPAIRRYDDPQLGPLVGLSHFIDGSDRPTAVGTAYALKLALALGSTDGRLNHADLAGTLWRVQLPDGGWAARTQGRIGRPEITALVLGALSSASSETPRLTEAVSAFEQSISRADDPRMFDNTFLLTAVIDGLLRVAPRSPLLPSLRSTLLSGSLQDGYRNLLCWSDYLTLPSWRGNRVPSVAHTARAVVALQRMARAGLGDAASRAAVEQALQWLIAVHRFDFQVDHIRRLVESDNWEALTTSHFTSAWVARAVLGASAPELPGSSELLEAAICDVRAKQLDGVWSLDDGARPIWMTYQGITVLRDFALRRAAAS